MGHISTHHSTKAFYFLKASSLFILVASILLEGPSSIHNIYSVKFFFTLNPQFTTQLKKYFWLTSSYVVIMIIYYFHSSLHLY